MIHKFVNSTNVSEIHKTDVDHILFFLDLVTIPKNYQRRVLNQSKKITDMFFIITILINCEHFHFKYWSHRLSSGFSFNPEGCKNLKILKLF